MNPTSNVSKSEKKQPVPFGIYMFQPDPKNPSKWNMGRVDKTYPFDYKKGEVDLPTPNGGEKCTYFG
jgi:hypothetical protein